MYCRTFLCEHLHRSALCMSMVICYWLHPDRYIGNINKTMNGQWADRVADWELIIRCEMSGRISR